MPFSLVIKTTDNFISSPTLADAKAISIRGVVTVDSFLNPGASSSGRGIICPPGLNRVPTPTPFKSTPLSIERIGNIL